MAKRKNGAAVKLNSRYKRKLAAAAGIFAAGSMVGASVDFSGVPAYFEILKPSVTVVSDRTETPSADETAQTLHAAPAPSYTAPETEKTEVPVTVPVTPPAAEVLPGPVPNPEPSPVPDPVPEPVPEIPPETVPNPEPDIDFSDWMEAIFVPAEPPAAEPPVPEQPVPEQPVPEPSVPSVSVPSDAEPDEDWMDTDWFAPAPDSEAIPPAAPPTDAVPAPDTSSMTEELAGMLENVAVFWTPSDGKIHLDPACRAFGTVCFAGTLEEAQSVRTAGWCLWCAEHLAGTANTVFYVRGNVYATSEQLLRSYTYSDYINKIPSGAFGG